MFSVAILMSGICCVEYRWNHCKVLARWTECAPDHVSILIWHSSAAVSGLIQSASVEYSSCLTKTFREGRTTRYLKLSLTIFFQTNTLWGNIKKIKIKPIWGMRLTHRSDFTFSILHSLSTLNIETSNKFNLATERYDQQTSRTALTTDCQIFTGKHRFVAPEFRTFDFFFVYTKGRLWWDLNSKSVNNIRNDKAFQDGLDLTFGSNDMVHDVDVNVDT